MIRKKIFKELQINEHFFYKSSNYIYKVLNRYEKDGVLFIEMIADYGKFWKHSKDFDMNFTVTLLSGPETEYPAFLQDFEYLDYLLCHSENPLEILDAYKWQVEAGYEYTVQGIIEENIREIRFKDFYHYTGLRKKDYPFLKFNENALPLDLIAMEISELAHIEITEDVIIDTLTSYPKGYRNAILEPFDEKFKQLTGVSINRFIKNYIKNINQIEPAEEDDCPF